VGFQFVKKNIENMHPRKIKIKKIDLKKNP